MSSSEIRNCFFCIQDTDQWELLTWPEVDALYSYCGVKCPATVCCSQCRKKPDRDLYREFVESMLIVECGYYLEKKPSIIKDKQTFDMFIEVLNDMGAIEKARKFLSKHPKPVKDGQHRGSSSL